MAPGADRPVAAPADDVRREASAQDAAKSVQANRTSTRKTLDEEDSDDDVIQHEQGNTKKILQRFAKNVQTIDREDLLNCLQSQYDEEVSLLKFPPTLLFFMFFVIGVLWHENIEDSGLVQRELRGMLSGTTFEGVSFTSGHKDLDDIATKEDVYLYLKEALVPLFINPLTDSNGQQVPAEERHRVLRYNQIIGGVQLQQVRRQKKSCSAEYPDMGPFPRAGRTNPLLANFDCYPWWTESDDCFGPVNTTLRAMLPGGFCPDTKTADDDAAYVTAASAAADTRRMDSIPNGGGTGGSTKGASDEISRDNSYSVFLYEYEGLEASIKKVAMLEQNGWIDFNTAWVGMRMLVLNPDLAIFVHVTVNVYFVPSGALLPKISAQSFQPEPYQFMSVIAIDIAWLIILMFVAFHTIRALFDAAKTRTLTKFMSDGWKVLDLMTVLGGLVIIILWLILLNYLTAAKKKAMEVRLNEPQPGYSSDAYPALVAAMHEEMTALSGYLSTFRLILCWYTILISMKFLESFAAQPRLALVTTTIARAATDLCHFLIVLVTIFMSYCVAGMFLFGRRLWVFSSLPLTINTCFRMMLGDFDWDELGEEHPTTAGIWFWSYMILMMLLMMNMLMAIIMDVYTSVKGDASEIPPIWTQVWAMVLDIRARLTGREVGLYEILQVVKNEMEDDEVSEEVLISAVGTRMSQEQAKALLQKTKEKVEGDLDKGVTMTEAMRMIGWVKIAVQKIGWMLEEVMEEEREEHRLLSGEEDGAGVGAMVPAAGKEKAAPYAADADGRLTLIEQRLSKISEFMEEALHYTAFRGKDLRNRLAVIEDLIRSQRDLTTIRVERDMWDQMPSKLGRDGGSQAGF